MCRTDVIVCEEAGLQSFEVTIEKHCYHCAEHVVRMEDTWLGPKRVFFGKLSEGSKSQKGLRKCYKDLLKQTFKTSGINEDSWEEEARNQVGWRCTMF